MFQYFNAEPSGERLQDCVIRAISLALQTPYDRIVELLNINGKFYSCDEISLYCYEKLLENLGFKKQDAYNHKVSEVAQYGSVVLIRIPGHLTCSIDGVVFDIWDCSDKEADCYWIIDRRANVVMLERIEAYLNSINIEVLSMEELEHYTNILIAIENKRFEDMHRTEILKQYKE